MSNRGEIKWAPFESLFRVQDVLSELETNRKKAIKPVLSEDELQAIEATLLEAFHTKSCVLIHYYYEGLSYQKKGLSKIFFKKGFFFKITHLYILNRSFMFLSFKKRRLRLFNLLFYFVSIFFCIANQGIWTIFDNCF